MPEIAEETGNEPVVAPRPTSWTFFMYCSENHVEDPGDGGLILLQALRGQLPPIAGEIIDARLAIVSKFDPWMREFPFTRVVKESRYFRLTVEEVAYADVPPDPDAPPELFNAAGQRVDQNGNLLR